ncbi:MAG: hypothetical protein CVU90_08665 [Firmicutes bacterium HGW-Firmicutes-15]|nr:MAG: hypothetical protein CVU90_08665 [Firmicutes bacterium HGW-Firmicutes-15]
MNQKKKPLLLTALVILLLLSFSTLASATDKQVDTSAATKTEQLKQIFPDVTSTNNNSVFINYLSNRKILSGFPDGNFHPEEGLTRAQAAVVLVKATGLETPAVTETGFPDVQADHWAAANIAAATKVGYLKGFPDGTYKPEDKLTRAQGIALIMRLSTQKDRVPLPVLNDMEQNHWAAGEMAVALAAEMIGLSADGKQIYPDAVMKRGSLARALGTLLTKDPGLYTVSLKGTIKDVKGDIKLTRNGATTPLQNDSSVYLGDTIITGANASASIFYPDGSSVLIKENTEINIKESIGRAYIKNDGFSGTSVENVDIDLKKGTVFGALATKHESTKKQQARANSPLLASLDSKQFIADNQAPWYQTAQTKKVRMTVDMPWGVAAVRGTFILVSVNKDGTCNVSCLTGNVDVRGMIGDAVPLVGGTSSGIGQGGTAGPDTKMSEQDKQAFGNVQGWVINTALQIDKNKEAAPPPLVEMILEIPDQPVEEKQEEQVQNMLDVVLMGLESSGIQLTEQVKQDLQQQLQDLQQELSQAAQEALQPDPAPNSNDSETNATIGVSAITTTSGTAKVGAELTAGALTPANATVSYQWMICATESGTYADIVGATTNKYTPVAGDATKFIKVAAIGTGSYSGTVTSAATAAVAGSSECVVTGVTSPAGGSITGNNITASVANNISNLTVDVSVSPDATWKLFSDDAYLVEITSKQMNLIVGSNQSYIKVIAQDGTTQGLYNLIVTRATSSTCVVTGVNSPAGGSISGNNITASVANNISSLTVDVSVSPDANWKLYSDSGYTTEIAQLINLVVGDNLSYIQVTAQDGTTQGNYNLTIRRLSNDATVTTAASHYTVDDTGNTIVAASTVINTNVTVTTFLANLTKHAQASWKVVITGTTIDDQTGFDTATAKSSTDTMLFGDKLAVKAEDGTINVYTITVVLGDPVLGGGSQPPPPSSNLYGANYGFTWGKYKYFLYDDSNNPYPYPVYIVAFNSDDSFKQQWVKTGCRYITGFSMDTNANTFTITTQQGGPTTFPWTDVLIPQP